MTTQPPRANGSVRSSPARVYSVPRRYDLATLFAVTLAYAILFALLRVFHATPGVMLATGAFIALVGLGQALLFKGSAPRAASALVGMIVWGIAPFVFGLMLSGPGLSYRDVERMMYAAPFEAIGGALLGYVTGVAVGGVFLIADYIRRGVRRLKKD